MADLEQSAQAADFVFRGTVERVNASALAAVEPSDTTAVVRVDQVLHAPETFGGLDGQEVTVQLREPGSLKAGEQVVLSANGWLYGESLALQEVAHQPAEEEAEALAARVATARTARADQEMQDRVARADVIVSGRVADVRVPVGAAAVAAAQSEGVAVSEHDPQWREAVITVDGTIKGEPPSETTVLFPASQDVAWADAPKLHAGQEGVFLLHRNVEVPQLAAAVAAEVHTALSVLDVLPKEDQQRVQDLLGQTVH